MTHKVKGDIGVDFPYGVLKSLYILYKILPAVTVGDKA